MASNRTSPAELTELFNPRAPQGRISVGQRKARQQQQTKHQLQKANLEKPRSEDKPRSPDDYQRNLDTARNNGQRTKWTQLGTCVPNSTKATSPYRNSETWSTKRDRSRRQRHAATTITPVMALQRHTTTCTTTTATPTMG